MKLRRMATLALLATLPAAGLTGCSGHSALPDAYYAEGMVPIYPGSLLSDQMGSNSYGDGPDASWDAMAWWFKSKDDTDKIVAFYEARLTGWQKEVDGAGATTFTTVPPEGDEGEEVHVRINNDGAIQIGESVKSSKKAHKQS